MQTNREKGLVHMIVLKSYGNIFHIASGISGNEMLDLANAYVLLADDQREVTESK